MNECHENDIQFRHNEPVVSYLTTESYEDIVMSANWESPPQDIRDMSRETSPSEDSSMQLDSIFG